MVYVDVLPSRVLLEQVPSAAIAILHRSPTADRLDL